jgi:hypothetical protein
MQIEMQWEGDTPIGVLCIPASISNLLIGSDFEHIRSGESLALPISLGLCLILSALTNSHLVLSGDRTAWKENWGALLDFPLSMDFGPHDNIEVLGRTPRRLHS